MNPAKEFPAKTGTGFAPGNASKKKKSAILPTIKPLGDVDEDAAFFNAGSSGVFDINPPIGTAERLLLWRD